MNWMTVIKHTVSAKSPEICLALGIISFAGSVVTAVHAAPKAKALREANRELKEMMDESLKTGITGTDDVDENGDQITTTYTEEDYKNDMKIYTSRKIINEVKTWAVPGGLFALGVIFVFVSMGIMKKRNAATMALLASLTASFDKYRGRIRKDLGAEKELEYYTGMKRVKETVTVTDADGNESEVEVEKTVLLDESASCPFLSPYAIRITADNCHNFESLSGDPIYIGHWLETIQEMCNTHLHTDGIVYLDYVLDTLGVKIDPESNPNLNSFIAHNVGWIDTDYYMDVMTKEIRENDGDRYIDFGCWNDDGELRLVRGSAGEVYLDFNVDGWINGRVPRKRADHLRRTIEAHPEIER